MDCVFCEQNHGGIRITDNMESSKRYALTCDGKKLFLTSNDKYKGCFDIKFCPICGKNLKKASHVNIYRGCKQCRYHDVCLKRYKFRYAIEYKAAFGCGEFNDAERSKLTIISAGKLLIKTALFNLYMITHK